MREISYRKVVASTGVVHNSRCIVAWLVVIVGAMIFSGCASKPLARYSTDTTPMILVPVTKAGVVDRRARFREIFCEITRKRGQHWPDYRPCNEALVKLADEAPASGEPVNLDAGIIPMRVLMVSSLGAKCFEHFVNFLTMMSGHLSQYGYEASLIEVEALSGSARNAEIIRDAVMADTDSGIDPLLLLVGYSKGVPDILEAVAAYPEMGRKVAAVVSIAGAVGGSPLATVVTQSTFDLVRFFPGADCEPGDQGAMESIKPDVRKKWLANHPLPESIRYYSLVAYPEPDNISSILKGAYQQLSKIDARNDSQLLFYDQVIPGSVLLGYLNGDHWAVGASINRDHPVFAANFVDKNAFPREVLAEAIVRFVEEDLLGK